MKPPHGESDQRHRKGKPSCFSEHDRSHWSSWTGKQVARIVARQPGPQGDESPEDSRGRRTRHKVIGDKAPVVGGLRKVHRWRTVEAEGKTHEIDSDRGGVA